MNPPRLLRRAPLDIHDYAVHRADWGEALTAAATELWDNDYIHTVVKDRPKLRWASTQTCVAIDAYLHINAQRGRLPFRVSRPRLNPLFATLRCHTSNRRTVCSCRAQLAAARKRASPKTEVTPCLASSVALATPMHLGRDLLTRPLARHKPFSRVDSCHVFFDGDVVCRAVRDSQRMRGRHYERTISNSHQRLQIKRTVLVGPCF